MRITIATASVLALAIACWRGQAREPLDQQRMAYKDGTTAEALDSEIITPNEIALGDSVFNGPDGSGICATCHGRNGVGIPGAAPSLSDSEWINGDGSIGFIKGMIFQGVPHPLRHPLPMPGFGHTLTDRQWQAVAAYVYALSHGGLPASLHGPIR
jgi:mono/diheme cytochrome c family protein